MSEHTAASLLLAVELVWDLSINAYGRTVRFGSATKRTGPKRRHYESRVETKLAREIFNLTITEEDSFDKV